MATSPALGTPPLTHDASELIDALRWIDSRDFPQPERLPFVRVATHLPTTSRPTHSTLDDLRFAGGFASSFQYFYALLVAEDEESFTVLCIILPPGE